MSLVSSNVNTYIPVILPRIKIMSDKQNELDLIMKQHKLTARQVGVMLNREPHTVRCWRSKWEGRSIPEHALELLKLRIAQAASEAAK